MKLKKLFFSAIILFGFSNPAFSQSGCGGQFDANKVCGTAGSPGFPGPITASFPASSIIVGTTTVASGTTTAPLFNNAGVLGNGSVSSIWSSFTQNGAGAVATNFDALYRATFVTPEMFGTTCSGVDDGPTIQLAINYAIVLRSAVKLKPCVYKVVTPIVDNTGIWLVGDNEFFSSTLDFAPTSDNQVMYRVRNAGNVVSGGGIQKVLFFSHDTTHIKTAIELEDTSGYTIEDIYIQGSASNVWGGGAGGSIGLRTKGREFTRVNRATIIAQRPLMISDNPNSTIDSDWSTFTNMTLVGAAHPNIEMETGVNFTHLNFDNVACVQGTYCFYNNDTTTSQISEGLTFRNFGNEQGTDGTAWNFYIHRNTLTYQIEFSGFHIWDAARNGASLRNIQGIKLNGVMANGVSPTQCFDTDSTVHGLSWFESTFLSCSTTSFLGQTAVIKETLNAGHVLPRWAIYASTSDSSALQTTSIVNAGTIASAGVVAAGSPGSVNGQFQVLGITSGSGTAVAQNVMGSASWLYPTNSGTFAVSASSPVVLNATTGNLTCPTCATTSGANIPTIAQGDLLFGSAANTLSALAKDTNATRYLSNTGTSNNPAWAQVNLANGVTGNLPVTNLNSGTSASSTTFWRGDGTWATPAGGGTVTSVGWTGGIVSVATPTSTPAFTIAGTSGGIPYFSSTSTWASSALLTANAITLGGGAGAAPASLGSLGTTTTVLHGNVAGAPTFGSVVSADMNITTSSCTNQFITAISAGGVGTCTTDTLASAQHANQGTTTTVLHGNASGNPSFGAVALGTDVSGTLAAAQFPALTGDVTTSAGALATTLATTQGAVHTWSSNQTFSTNINIGGTSLGAPGTHNVEIFSGTTNTNVAVLAMGRDTTHNASIVWNVGASAAADDMRFSTFGFANPLFIDGSVLNLNTQSNGSILTGVGLTTISAALTLTSISSDAAAADSTLCRVTSTGSVRIGSGTIGICLGTSSARFKNRIADLSDGLDELMKLKPVNFYYNKDIGHDPSKIQYGFTAEQVIKILPALVAKDEQNRPNTVDILGMVPILVKAVQQLKADNDNLREEVKKLANGKK